MIIRSTTVAATLALALSLALTLAVAPGAVPGAAAQATSTAQTAPTPDPAPVPVVAVAEWPTPGQDLCTARSQVALPDRTYTPTRGRTGQADAAGDPAFAQEGGYYSPFNDFCDDGPPGLDTLFGEVVADPGNPGALLFTTYFCAPVDLTQMDESGFVGFALNGGVDGDGWDYAVQFYPDPAAPTGMHVDVIRVPDNSDPGTWFVTASGDAQHPAADTIGTYVPLGAIGGLTSFAFFHLAQSDGPAVDHTPEVEEIAGHAAFHPNACGGVVLATATGTPARLEQTARLATAAGLVVDARLLEHGALGVSTHTDDPALQAIARSTGVTLSPRPRYSTAQGSGTTPTDPLVPRQHHLGTVGAPGGWARTVGDPDVVIAVLDDGVDGTVGDLLGRTARGFNAFTSTPVPHPVNSARGFHGTAVATVAAAAGDDMTGGAGITWRAQVLPLVAFDTNGCADDLSFATAIRHAVDVGADVINISAGGIGDATPPLTDALAHAAANDVIVVASSGNTGPDQAMGSPANVPSVVAVGSSTTAGDAASTFSTGGPRLAIVAPGEGIVTVTEGDGEITIDGTSFSAPQVAGAAALWLAVNPAGTAEAFRQDLLATARDLGPAGRDDRTGAGMLDVAGLLAAVGPPPAGDGRHLDAADPTSLSVAVSRARFTDDAARHVVLSRDDVFPDSLAGTVLTGEGPLLYTPTDRLHDAVAGELGRVAPAGATVYLLGGTSALSPAVEEAVRAAGFVPQRLAGPSRVHTAMSVADEARTLYGGTSLAVARADDWADSVTAGAWAAASRTPIVVTPGAALHPDLEAWVRERRPTATVVLGGTAAVTEQAANQLAGASGTVPQRVAGPSRDTTAIAVADTLLAGSTGAIVIDGYGGDGWVAGLVAAGPASDANRVLLLSSSESLPDPTRTRIAELGCAAVSTVSLSGRLPQPLLSQVDAAAGCT